MKEALHKRLESEFGPPTSETQYVLRWHVEDGLDVVVERRGTDGKLWTAWPGGEGPSLPFGRRRPPGDGVNSNVYAHSAVPSLAGGDLFELRITTDHELDCAIAWLKGRLSGLRHRSTGRALA